MNTHFFAAVASASLLLSLSNPLRAEEGIKDRLLDLKDRALDAAHDTKNAIIDGGATAKEKAREEWRKSKGYLSDDPVTYRQSARERLDEVNGDIAVLRHDAADIRGHGYFQARIGALEEQYREVSAELTALPPAAARHPDEQARRQLDDNLDRLERYVSLAQDEERDLRANP